MQKLSGAEEKSSGPGAADPSAIVFHDVTLVVPGGRAIVDKLSFDIKAGETLVLLGRSGSGKTTTLKLINRLIDPTRGRILIDGKSTIDWDTIRLRRHIGYVIQETGLFPHFTIERNVGLIPGLERWPRDKVLGRVRELLGMVGLEPDDFLDRYPAQLSGGQRQRVGVARALAADPPIVLMDEPFGALDPITRAELQKEFARLASRLHKTIVFVTHDVREALILATRIGLFQGGRLVELAGPREFLESTQPEARPLIHSMQDPVR
jgi:osmoprotectant transport system ATP-binding protein